MPADTGRVAVYQYRTGKMPKCKTVDHCYKGGSKTVVDRYHSGNNLGTGPVLFQYYNVYWNFSNIVFAYIAHAKFQKPSFNSNRDIRQNIRGDGEDGGYGDGTQNNTSRRFQKRVGGKQNLMEIKNIHLC